MTGLLIVSAIVLITYSILGPVLLKALRTGEIQVSTRKIHKRKDFPGRYWFAMGAIFVGLLWLGVRWLLFAIRVLG